MLKIILLEERVEKGSVVRMTQLSLSGSVSFRIGSESSYKRFLVFVLSCRENQVGGACSSSGGFRCHQYQRRRISRFSAAFLWQSELFCCFHQGYEEQEGAFLFPPQKTKPLRFKPIATIRTSAAAVKVNLHFLYVLLTKSLLLSLGTFFF